MFEDEAGFGRIFRPASCWARLGVRPNVAAHHIREMRYAFGAVAPQTGDSFFLALPYCTVTCMNLFLQQLSDQYPDKMIILICNNAVWHKARALFIPANIEMLYIPPYTPEMNPIERIWREFRRRGFVNRVFQTLEKVVDRLCEVIQGLTKSDVKSITHAAWLIEPDLTMS